MSIRSVQTRMMNGSLKLFLTTLLLVTEISVLNFQLNNFRMLCSILQNIICLNKSEVESRLHLKMNTDVCNIFPFRNFKAATKHGQGMKHQNESRNT